MIYGNKTTFIQVKSLINMLLADESQTVYPFILIAGPAHVGKASVIHDIINWFDINPYDVVTMQDLSDDWMLLKESNDLTGTSHSIQIEVESKRNDITIADKSIVHNRWVRELQEWLVRSPIGRDKVVVIEAIERATWWASNALLKTLEEPLPHRLMIATTHSISQLPATIISRAMIFHVDRLSDDDMRQRLTKYKNWLSSSMFDMLIQLADGRPWVIIWYDHKGQLDELISYWIKLNSELDRGTIASLYQHMVLINKWWYLDVILNALLHDAHYYNETFDLICKQESNIENLLFEWCCRIIK